MLDGMTLDTENTPQAETPVNGHDAPPRHKPRAWTDAEKRRIVAEATRIKQHGPRGGIKAMLAREGASTPLLADWRRKFAAPQQRAAKAPRPTRSYTAEAKRASTLHRQVIALSFLCRLWGVAPEIVQRALEISNA